jgi:hypothetical protein
MPAAPIAAFIRANLRMKPTTEGGRSRPIASGYRCNCWFGARTDTGERSYNDAVIHLESTETLEPGSSAAVLLQPTFPDLWGEIEPGFVIDVCEGSRVVGEVTVIELSITMTNHRDHRGVIHIRSSGGDVVDPEGDDR